MHRHQINKKPVSFHSTAIFYSRGFTLVELMVTLAIAAILIGAGVPMVSSMITGNQIETEAGAVRNILSLARAEAITRRTYITLCARKPNNSQDCLPAATNDDWKNNGWLLFRDTATSGPANMTDPSQVIQVHEPMSGNVELTITGDPAYIRFSPRGDSYPINTTFKFCMSTESNERHDRGVVLSNGRVRTVNGEGTLCLP